VYVRQGDKHPNESPEDTKVIGATKGSLILVLAGTVTVTKLLAVISKNITSVARDVISVGIAREDLRQKKLLTTTMAGEFKKMESTKRAEGLSVVMAEIKKLLPKPVPGDTETALTSSVKKLLEFNEKGGNVDFVAPSDDTNEEGDENDPHRKLLTEVRKVIHEYQGEREAVRLLTHRSADTGEGEVS
jgi:hypothetical protein